MPRLTKAQRSTAKKLKRAREIKKLKNAAKKQKIEFEDSSSPLCTFGEPIVAEIKTEYTGEDSDLAIEDLSLGVQLNLFQRLFIAYES